MKNLYSLISQYQRGYKNVLNQLITFRNNKLSFKVNELNQLYASFPRGHAYATKEFEFLSFLTAIFENISLRKYSTHQEILSYIYRRMNSID